MIGWQWHQLDDMQIIFPSLLTDTHAGTPPLSFLTGRMPFLPPNEINKQHIWGLLITRRYTSAVWVCYCLCVCPSVCLSDISRCSVNTAKHVITQTTAMTLDSQRLVFLGQRWSWNYNWVTINVGVNYTRGRKNLQLSTDNSLYLEIDTDRHSVSTKADSVILSSPNQPYFTFCVFLSLQRLLLESSNFIHGYAISSVSLGWQATLKWAWQGYVTHFNFSG